MTGAFATEADRGRPGGEPGSLPRGYDTPTGDPCPRCVRLDGSVDGDGACHGCGYCLAVQEATWPACR